MEKDFENIDALVAKFLAGETNPEETAFLENWRKQSPANKIYFEDNKKVFESLAALKNEHDLDVNAAWARLNKKISIETKVIPLQRRKTVMRVAASLLLLVSLGLMMTWLLSETAEPLLLKATAGILESKLPDGSKVSIQQNSEITYVKKKDGKREVILKGEAFFEVLHDATQPFVIHVNDVMIEDVGTAFNVKEDPAGSSVEVRVESGEVKFFSETDAGINLVMGEKATYDKVTRQFRKIVTNSSENSGSFKSKVFEFKETSLKDVVAQVNEVYGCDIRLANDLKKDLYLNVIFNNENVNDIVNIIAETLDLEVEKRGNTVIFKNKPVSN